MKISKDIFDVEVPLVSFEGGLPHFNLEEEKRRREEVVEMFRIPKEFCNIKNGKQVLSKPKFLHAQPQNSFLEG